jgi:hypothetical protein
MVDFNDKDLHMTDTRPLVREGAQKRQDSNFEKRKNLWSNIPDLGLTPRHTD